MARVRRLVPRLLLPALAVASMNACAGGESAQPASAPSSPTTGPSLWPTPTETEIPRFTSDARPHECRGILDRDEIYPLVGGTVPSFTVERISDEPDAPYACTGVIYDDRGLGSWIGLAVVPAHEAVGVLQQALENLDGSPRLTADRQAVVTDALTALRSREIDDEDGCAAFAALAYGLVGDRKDATYSVLSTATEHHETLFAHACTDGVYTALSLWGKPGFADADATKALMRDAVASFSPGELT